MYTPDITIGTDIFSLITQRASSSVRQDGAKDLTNPCTLSISHETAKNGKISSVVILDSEEVIPCNDACSTVPLSDNIRLQMKLQYNPSSGRLLIDTEIARLQVQMLAFISDATNWSKLLNKES